MLETTLPSVTLSVLEVYGDRFETVEQFAEIQRVFNLYQQKVDKYQLDVKIKIESSNRNDVGATDYTVIAEYTDEAQVALLKLLEE